MALKYRVFKTKTKEWKEMKKMKESRKQLLILVLFVLLVIAAVAVTSDSFKVGDQVYLETEHRVNPRDFGPAYWMLQQNDNCYLKKGEAKIVDVSPNGEFVLLSQEECSGWGIADWLSKVEQ
jgi:hypothetical protein